MYTYYTKTDDRWYTSYYGQRLQLGSTRLMLYLLPGTIFLKYMFYRCALKRCFLHTLICIVYLLKCLNNNVTVASCMCRPIRYFYIKGGTSRSSYNYDIGGKFRQHWLKTNSLLVLPQALVIWKLSICYKHVSILYNIGMIQALYKGLKTVNLLQTTLSFVQTLKC
jgi:hypothetical protein